MIQDAMTPTLVADVGGTNTRLALASGGVVIQDSIRRFRNEGATGLVDQITRYCHELSPDRLSGVSVAIAGPVCGKVGQLTNLNWRITEEDLQVATGARHVAILNDLQAQGHALSLLSPSDLQVVKPGADLGETATRLVVGLGTGMNIAPVYQTGHGLLVPPSECGHITLPQHRPELQNLAQDLKDAFGFSSVEEALAGRGLVNIHRHLHGKAPSGQEIMTSLAAGDAKAEATARLYITVLGTIMGDLSLIHLPFGGLYLVGGMSRAIAPYLSRLGFDEAFTAKGRFGDFMGQFGVSVVTDDFAALKGCAASLHSEISA